MTTDYTGLIRMLRQWPADVKLMRDGADALEAMQAALSDSCAEERSQLWEAGPGGGCSRALEAENELSALRQQLAEAVRDAERLNWLEQKLFVGRWNAVIDGGSRTDWTIASDWRHTTVHMTGDSFRAAIDAAIAAGAQK